MMNPHGIMFHHFHDGNKHPIGQGSITAQELHEMLCLYGKTHAILSAEEWYEKAVAGNLSPNETCLTFDDNLRCQFDIALPVLESWSVKAFWFIYTSPLDNLIEKLEVYRYFRNTAFEHIDEFYAAFDHAVGRAGLTGKVQAGLKAFSEDYLAESGFYSRSDKMFRYVRDRVLTKDEYDHVMQDMIAGSGLAVDTITGILWMDRPCILSLREKGHVIGLHSHTHPTVMRQLSREQQAAESFVQE
jgi:peptidoglycan/xylan/chitin deacetylase (PgdA/CDA1 family)